jgi:hypothetical protein
MTSNETMSAVRTFLESYRDAFERPDAAAIADHFVSPGVSGELALTSSAMSQNHITPVVDGRRVRLRAPAPGAARRQRTDRERPHPLRRPPAGQIP